MAMHPEVQKKAQAELDAVVGPDRLPEHSDREYLPYVNAVCKEALRWTNVVPLGVVHRSMADDEYNGYFLPEGTLFFTNVWSVALAMVRGAEMEADDLPCSGQFCMTQRYSRTQTFLSLIVT